jgi:hypothetical protein
MRNHILNKIESDICLKIKYMLNPPKADFATNNVQNIKKMTYSLLILLLLLIMRNSPST